MSTDNKNKRTNEEKVEEMEETIGRGGEQARKAIEMRARAAREAMREGADKAGAIRRARTIRKGMKEGNEAEKEKNQDDDARA